MNEIEEMLRKLARKTMFDVSDEEMPALVKEYMIFMKHVEALEVIDTTDIEPLAFPYEIETTFLRDDEALPPLLCEEVLKNAPSVQDQQIKVPKVVI